MTQKWKNNQTTSKIYKLYIDGNPKRPGTQQYPYLGPKIVVVAEKLDPTVGQLCFHRIFQTVWNLRKGTTEMSSESPKWWVGGMGRPGISGKHQNPATQGGGGRRLRRPDPGAFSYSWPEILPARLPCHAPPPWPTRVQGWWPATPPTAKTRLVFK